MKKFSIRDVPAAGNCLFEAIGRSCDMSAHNLREIVVSFLKIPNQELQDEPVKTWIEGPIDKYIQTISKNGAWGGGLEISILANLLHRRIIVYAPSGSSGNARHAKIIAEFYPKETILKDIHILYVGNHYMQLIEE